MKCCEMFSARSVTAEVTSSLKMASISCCFRSKKASSSAWTHDIFCPGLSFESVRAVVRTFLALLFGSFLRGFAAIAEGRA